MLSCVCVCKLGVSMLLVVWVALAVMRERDDVP